MQSWGGGMEEGNGQGERAARMGKEHNAPRHTRPDSTPYPLAGNTPDSEQVPGRVSVRQFVRHSVIAHTHTQLANHPTRHMPNYSTMSANQPFNLTLSLVSIHNYCSHVRISTVHTVYVPHHSSLYLGSNSLTHSAVQPANRPSTRLLTQPLI